MPDVTPIPKAFKPPTKRKPLPPRSPKRISQQEQREEVRRVTLERAGYRCQGPDAGLPEPCAFYGERGLEVHEARQRSTHPGSHLSAEDTWALCSRHHDAVSSPEGVARELAERLGLLIRATT